MGDKEDYLTSYRVFFENFAATVNPEDQLPVHIAGYTITESELPGEVLYWTTQYLSGKQCPLTLMTPLRRIILDEVRVASKKYPNEFGYKSDESVYIALRLMQAVTARVNDICLRYLDNSRLDTLPPPPPLEQRDLKTISCATKNSRRVMEDRHVEIGNLEALFGIETTEPTSFYAVYDGHAGSAAATYCAAHLHQYLVESSHFTKDLTRAMHDAFLRTDAEFIRKSNQERANGGSTAVAVAVRGRTLLAAWAGDSLALLAKRMRLMQLVRPHKPSRPDERDRIEASGGTVMYWGTWRVNGQLAVSRAIGDAQYKPHVIARPEIATVDLDGDEDFVVVACDGLWDFVSEDDVALAVYRQLAADPDDLKAVTKRLILLAKRQGSSDNISIIVVFLKEPRDIAADNCPPMDLGLDNALANAPPFVSEPEVCKRPADAAAAATADDGDAEGEAEADNGVDNSDSDSEDLGPETAVDADDIDADARVHEPAAPTPPADTVEVNQIDAALVDNVAESGDDSEDEWNYFKGEGDRDRNPSEEPDEPPRSETPCQDNSAWESSSVDMNSSPLNPDAPVFIPGSVAGADVLLAESPRKPLPMDDIELPDVAQFETEAVVRPAELLDLDNCDQLNGHHNVSIESTVKEHLNGNDKCNMDSLGFGFNVGIEPDKVKDSLIQDFERIQKDTTDFCNIQVFQTQTEINPFAVEDNDELFERLKNKERDPMSMSFYQEKDDDTCERIGNKEPHVDLNAVQLLPDSDDEDIHTNGVHEAEKENLSPRLQPDDSHEPNNDILRFHDQTDRLSSNIANMGQGDNCIDYNVTDTNNPQSYPHIEFETGDIPPEGTVLQTDTPESHKLLFEQIPEIPDGKSSELGFSVDDMPDRSESERAVTPQDETSHDVDMDSKDASPCEDAQPNLLDVEFTLHTDRTETPVAEQFRSEIESAAEMRVQPAASPAPSPAPREEADEVTAEIAAEADRPPADLTYTDPFEIRSSDDMLEERMTPLDAPEIRVEEDREPTPAGDAVSPAPSPQPLQSATSPQPFESAPSPQPFDSAPSPQPVKSATSPQPFESAPSPQPFDSAPSPLPVESVPSPLPHEVSLPRDSPLPTDDASLMRDSPLPTAPSLPRESPLPAESPLPGESSLPVESLPLEEPTPILTFEESFIPQSEHLSRSPLPVEATPLVDFITESVREEPVEERPAASPLPAEVPLPHESPAPSPAPAPASPAPAPASLAPAPASPAPAPPSPAPVVEEPLALVEEATLAAAAGGAAPDIVPEPRTDLVTDLDVGVPESRAHEICVPVTSEIRPEAGERGTLAATPPPTPAVEPTIDPLAAAAIGAGAAAVAAAVAVTAAASKPSAITKKSPTTPSAKTDARTPKSAPRTAPTTTRTPASAKRPASAATTPRTPASSASRLTAARTPTSARTAASPAAKTASPAAKASPVPRAAAPKPPASKPAPITRPVTSTTTATKPAPKPAAPRVPRAAPASAPAPKPTSAPRPTAPRSAPAKPAAPKPAAPKPAAPTRTAPRPATAPAARPAASATSAAKPIARRLPEKKPLPNGDVKESKPTTRPAPAARPAPRPAPRSAAPAAPTTARTAAPKPASRAAPLDKQSKDLANKRITAKTAPSRTGPIKAPVSTKMPACIKKPAPKDAPAPVKDVMSITSNGTATGDELAKPPPSPPAQDNALLPDVIA